MKPGLQLRVSQNLVLAPQLQQAIRLLLLSTTELQQEVQEMIESNPFLDEDHDTTSDDSVSTSSNETQTSQAQDYDEPATSSTQTEESTSAELTEMDWSQNDQTADTDTAVDNDWPTDSSYDSTDWGNTSKARQLSDSDDDNDIFDSYSEGISLCEHLEQQARTLQTSEEDITALVILIRSLNENGYLDSDIEDIADQLLDSRKNDIDYELQHEDLVERLSQMLLLLQTFDPPGIAARNLSECLIIQLKQLPEHPFKTLAIELCSHCLDDLARRDYRKIAAQTSHTESEVREAFQLIQSLDPKPGRQYVTESEPIIIPDVIVKKSKMHWQATLNPEIMPNIRVNEIYANALRKHKGQDGTEALNQRLQEARWFIKNVQQRFDTILRVSQAIIDRQRNFFTHGEMGMRPLVLREIAEELDLHESTISRVTTAKYMQTPLGVYELKYFFGSGVATESGGSASSTAVRALIKKIISEEDPKKPLSDNTISDMLAEQGVQIARRTVAKYRDELKIPTATLRKAI